MSADSILKEMMAQVSGMAEDKRKAGAGLTPVAAERPRTRQSGGGAYVPTDVERRTGSLPEAGQMVGPGKRAEWSAGYGIPNGPGGDITADPDVIAGRIRDVRRELQIMLASLDLLEQLWVVPQEAPVPQPAEQAPVVEQAPAQPDEEQIIRAATSDEGAAQVAFELALAEKTAAAQAQAFTPSDYDPQTMGGPGDGWSCPTHGMQEVVDKVSPKGRQFRKCTAAGCAEFEK